MEEGWGINGGAGFQKIHGGSGLRVDRGICLNGF